MNLKSVSNAMQQFIKDPQKYMIFCFGFLFLLVGLNSFYFIVKEAFGHGGGTFLFTSDDRYADIIKTALSYKSILLENPNFENQINKLSPLYQGYYYKNPYGGIDQINTLTHFHLTPISTLLNISVGVLIGYGLNPSLIMILLFVVCIGLFFVSIYNIFKSYKTSLLFAALLLFTYPFLMIITRGNYSSFFSGIGVLAFLFSLFINKKVDYFSLILFCVAINFRPNAIILLLAIPLVLGIKDSIWPIIKIGIASLGMYVVLFFIVNHIYPDYTFKSFTKALSVYNNLYCIGHNGLPFNSSLHGGLKIIGKLLNLNSNIVMSLFYVSSLVILLAVGRMIFIKNSVKEYYPFLLASIYILLNPVSADYHLLIFVFPIFMIYNRYEYWQKNQIPLIIVTISTLLVLSPKNYFFVKGVSLQVLINPLIILFTTIYLTYMNERNHCMERTHFDSK